MHFAYVYGHNGHKVDLYINGILVGTNNNVTSDPISVPITYLGANNTENRYLNGEICNFMRYDRALTSSEIAQNALVDNMRFISPIT